MTLTGAARLVRQMRIDGVAPARVMAWVRGHELSLINVFREVSRLEATS